MTSPSIDQLIAQATDARERSYSPYSRFAVGAALLFEDGHVVTGCNVENASYGLAICAERTAMTRAIAEGRGKPVMAAVVTDTPEPVSPCGACRQFLSEFNPDMVVWSATLGGKRRSWTVRELLPDGFSPKDLG